MVGEAHIGQQLIKNDGANEGLQGAKRAVVARFLEVTGAGYQLAAADPAAATHLLAQAGLAAFTDKALVPASLALRQPTF